MKELGSLLKEQRESKGISISEVSADLSIKDVILENMEEGNIGAFKDIFVLKENIKTYAKYLGLNPDNLIDEFNEYLFEYTSKIPLSEIEKEIEKENKEEKTERIEAVSPYTNPIKEKPKKYFLILYAIIALIIIIVFVWSIKEITINTKTTNGISYVK